MRSIYTFCAAIGKGVLILLFTLIIVIGLGLLILQWALTSGQYKMCDKDILSNDQEAIGALKYELMTEKEYDRIEIIFPIRKISYQEVNDFDISAGWRAFVQIYLDDIIVERNFLISNCAEIIEPFHNQRRRVSYD